MKRRVKVIAPLDDCQKLDAQMLDPRWPLFYSKVPNAQHSNQRSTIAPDAQPSQSWTGSARSVTTRTDHQQQSLSTRCASVPAYAINSASRTGNGARCPESFQLPENNRSQSVDSAERGRAQFPSKLQNGATGANAGRSGADDSSSKSSSSSTNVDQDISGFGGTKAENVFDRQKARAKNEENDVHAAARRSLEQSRQSQTQTPRQSSTPMSIPPRKHSRKLFGF